MTMKISGILSSLILLLLTGCENNNNGDQSPLLGAWVTESCDQASDSNGAPIDLWVKGLYEFTAQDTIRFGHEGYSDSNCTILVTTSTTPSEVGFSTAYQDLGSQMLQEGVNGGGLLIGVSTGGEYLPIDGYYIINNNSLCFSDVFTFEALGFGISEVGLSAIDFDHCLIRP